MSTSKGLMAPLTTRAGSEFQVRRLTVGAFTSQVGNGAWFATWALYLTAVLGFATATVGVVMAAAGACALASATPLGRLADRLGPKGLFMWSRVVEGAATAAYIVADRLWLLLLVACVQTTASAGIGGVRDALVTGLVDTPEARLEALARMRSRGHLGVALGAGLGALILLSRDRFWFDALIVANALSSLAYAAIVRTVSPVVPPLRREGTAWRATRDVRFLGLTVVTAVLTLNWGMMSAGLPLWAVSHTRAPLITVGVSIFLSAVAIGMLQPLLSRLVVGLSRAAWAATASGVLFAIACMLWAAAGGRSACAATCILAGTICHITAELLFMAAAWGITIALMPDDAQGEYQGVMATGTAAAIMGAPAVMLDLVVPNGSLGWAWLALAFLMAGLAAPLFAFVRPTRRPTTRSRRTRSRAGP